MICFRVRFACLTSNSSSGLSLPSSTMMSELFENKEDEIYTECQKSSPFLFSPVFRLAISRPAPSTK